MRREYDEGEVLRNPGTDMLFQLDQNYLANFWSFIVDFRTFFTI
jgi:hypothetical protein